MILRKEIYHYKASGFISVFDDDYGKFTVSVTIIGQKSLYPKTFSLKETALNYALWVERNWAYHIKDVPIIKTTPLTYL